MSTDRAHRLQQLAGSQRRRTSILDAPGLRPRRGRRRGRHQQEDAESGVPAPRRRHHALAAAAATTAAAASQGSHGSSSTRNTGLARLAANMLDRIAQPGMRRARRRAVQQRRQPKTASYRPQQGALGHTCAVLCTVATIAVVVAFAYTLAPQQPSTSTVVPSSTSSSSAAGSSSPRPSYAAARPAATPPHPRVRDAVPLEQPDTTTTTTSPAVDEHEGALVATATISCVTITLIHSLIHIHTCTANKAFARGVQLATRGE